MLYPFKFLPILVERVWGGQSLSKYGKSVPYNKCIGESWEISDRDDAQSVVANGEHQGKTLRALINLFGTDLLGRKARNSDSFPLLVKLLDARERLSLQVHPPKSIAKTLGGEPKTEMWYVLDSVPDAHLIAGLKPDVTKEQFVQALYRTQKKNGLSLEDCVCRFPVYPGDAFFVPSGRIHAIDAGVVLIEIQQSSDTTYRVFDWNRVGLDGKQRTLHIQESLASIDFSDFEPTKIPFEKQLTHTNHERLLVNCSDFSVSELVMYSPHEILCDETSFQIIACVEGRLNIHATDGDPVQLTPGEFALLPASLGLTQLIATTGRAIALRSSVG